MKRLLKFLLRPIMAIIAIGLIMRAWGFSDPVANMIPLADTPASLDQPASTTDLPARPSPPTINSANDLVSIPTQFATPSPVQAIASYSESVEWPSQPVNFVSESSSHKKPDSERGKNKEQAAVHPFLEQKHSPDGLGTTKTPNDSLPEVRQSRSERSISNLPDINEKPSLMPIANPFFDSPKDSATNASTSGFVATLANPQFSKPPTGAINDSNFWDGNPTGPDQQSASQLSRPTTVHNAFIPAKTERHLDIPLADSHSHSPSPNNRVAALASFPTPASKPAHLTIQPTTNRSLKAPPKPAQTPITDGQTPDAAMGALMGASSFKLAAQPALGDLWKDDRPLVDCRANLTATIADDFSPDPVNECLPYDPYCQMNVYDGKTLNANQRPILELGRPWYQLGQLSPGSNILGKHNPLTPQFLIYGDYRAAFASNTQDGNNVTRSAAELNLDFDLKLTGTERFHMFMAPLDNGTSNSGYLFDENRYDSQFDANIDFGYFEGDLGAIVGGLTNHTLPFDFPFAIGVMPLLLQNGIWMEDAFLGVAATIPARNSAKLNISNMDTTFFAGYDKINSPAFPGDDSAARMYGMASFIEALNGYIEIDYAFLDDRTFDDRSYHNIAFAYTRRYGRLISNSTRLIMNAGQSTDVVENTADGLLLLSENSLITGAPSTVVPYLNFFAGFDRPQSAARAAQAGGILRNTGILFESDGMTNYPTLDPTANDTLGGALGLNLLANDFSQQLVVEMAWLNVMGADVNRIAVGNQYGAGARYQLPLTNALIFRADAMVGFLDDASDIHGVRMELRHKW